MKIYVAPLGVDRDPHDVEYQCGAESQELESVLYVPVPRRISVRELDSQLKAIQSKWLRAGQLVVLRLHHPFATELLEDDLATDILRRRLEDLPVAAAYLGSDRSVQLTPVIDGPAPAYDPGQLTEAVRFAELHSWLDQPGVVLPPNDDFHYEGPNGYRYESFMRVGTAIQSMETLDGTSFWLQPHLQGSPIVVLDAWTINSVALNLGRYASHCGPPCKPIADLECLGAYDEDMERLKLRLETAYRRLEPETPALLVSSVVSQGNLHRQLESLLEEVGFEHTRSVALYGSEDFSGTAFCRPAEIGRYYREDDLDCPESEAIPIAPSTYLVEVAIKPNKEKISKTQAKRAWEFFDNYQGGDYFTVHRNEPGGERHHMIHVDVARMMPAPRFKRRLNEELDELRALSPDVILAPKHAAAAALATEASRHLGIERIPASETELPHLDESYRQKLRKAEDILIVDDVVISGARLLGYRNFLRRCDCFNEERPPRIHLLAGLARVPNNRTIDGIEDMVDERSRFHQVETLLLPDWGKSECPWCWELRQLERFGHTLPQTDRLMQRWRRLKAKEGLEDSLFLPWLTEGKDTLPVSVWELGEGSVFHAKSEIDLFVAVASVVQSMRNSEELSERQMFPVGRVLDPASWLTGRYYDSVIPAAILRATRRHDIRAPEIELELVKGMAPRFSNHDDLRGEMLLAMARRQLPVHPEVMTPGGLLADPSADPGFAALMRSAFEGPANRR
jgi:hypothetical protein